MSTASALPQNLTERLDAPLRERLCRLAETRRCAPRGLLDEAVREYVEREEKRDDFLKGAQASLKDYRETGLHLTGEEVNAWLVDIANGKMRELPECHE